MSNSRLLKILTCVGLVLFISLAIFIIVNRSIVQESATTKGPDRIEDASKLFSLEIPRGWYGQLGDNVINIQNYNPEKLVFDHGKPLNIPEDNVKMEVYIIELSHGQSFEQRIAVEKSQVTIQNEEDNYDFGTYKGITYSTEFSRVAAFLICDDKGIFVNIFPKNSEATEDALKIPATIKIISTESVCYVHN